MKPIIIQPTSGWKKINWKSLIAYREVLKMLIIRDLKIKYAQTWLGIGWIVFQPIFTVGLFSLIFGRWMKMGSDGIPYPLFIFCGLVAWVFISQSIQRASTSTQADSRLITKVYFPRLLMPMASVCVSMIDFSILLTILLALLKIYAVPLTWQFFLFPLFVLPLFVLALGVGSLFASVGVYYRDAAAILPFFLQTWMYTSPIIFSSSIVPEKWLWLYRFNPLAGILDAFRWSLLGLPTFPMESLVAASIISCVVGIFGILVFSRLERRFADVL